MIIRKTVLALALASLSGVALAGKSGVPGGGTSGSGGNFGSDVQSQSTVGFGLVNVPGNPGLVTRISNLPGAVTLADGSIVSPPVRMPNGQVVRITVDKSGKIVKVEAV